MSRVTVDLDDFDDLLRQASLAEPVQALGLRELAGQIPRGQLLEDEPYADWAEKGRTSYNGRHMQSMIAPGGSRCSPVRPSQRSGTRRRPSR